MLYFGTGSAMAWRLTLFNKYYALFFLISVPESPTIHIIAKYGTNENKSLLNMDVQFRNKNVSVTSSRYYNSTINLTILL